MRVTFALNQFRTRPAGGFLVVYRYANAFAERGHRVTVVHPRRPWGTSGVIESAKAAVWPARHRVRFGGRPPWFELDRRVEVVLSRDLSEAAVPDADAVFATACTTARPVAAYSKAKGEKFYLVQHYEEHLCGKEEVDATWRLPMFKVVSSSWLLDIGAALGVAGECTHIPYGIELDVFQLRRPLSERNQYRVGMLAHHWTSKGLVHGVDALARAKEAVAGLEAVVFGVIPRPDELPVWVEYVRDPSRADLVALYNSCSVFLHSSLTEGWGLTGAEAMACGCAFVASDSGGIRDYALQDETALIAPPGDGAALGDALVRVLNDPALRQRLASNGHAAIQDFTWERATDKLETLLESRVAVHAA